MPWNSKSKLFVPKSFKMNKIGKRNLISRSKRQQPPKPKLKLIKN